MFYIKFAIRSQRRLFQVAFAIEPKTQFCQTDACYPHLLNGHNAQLGPRNRTRLKHVASVLPSSRPGAFFQYAFSFNPRAQLWQIDSRLPPPTLQVHVFVHVFVVFSIRRQGLRPPAHPFPQSVNPPRFKIDRIKVLSVEGRASNHPPTPFHKPWKPKSALNQQSMFCSFWLLAVEFWLYRTLSFGCLSFVRWLTSTSASSRSHPAREPRPARSLSQVNSRFRFRLRFLQCRRHSFLSISIFPLWFLQL